MLQESLNIRNFTSHDIKKAMELVLAERWNQTDTEWHILMGNPQNVCLVAEVENELVGTATAINYNNKVAWIGMVLVSKNFRGQGISKKLLSNLLEQLTFCKCIKLDATPAGQPVYKKMGFEDEYLINRMTCLSFSKYYLVNGDIMSQGVQKEDIPAIVDLDKNTFGADRSQLIKALIFNNPEKCFVIKDKDRISGFALGRKGNRFHHIGPVVASSVFDAIQLILHALNELRGQSVVIDILKDKNELYLELLSLGFEKQRNFSRMYLHSNLYPGDINHQYLICGPEFG
jgi:GNAT superfamily N-acetyltransferase